MGDVLSRQQFQCFQRWACRRVRFPTAVLSAQTGYEDYHCVSLTEEMEQFRRSWEKMEARFDGIYTGFAADEEQIGHMIHIAETFHKKKAFLLVDPIMGIMDTNLISSP